MRRPPARTVLLCAALGCNGQISHDSAPTSGGAPLGSPRGGAGGAGAAAAGVGGATTDLGAASGGAAAGRAGAPPGGGAGAPPSAGASWDDLRAPLEGEHQIEARTCGAAAIPADYRVVPNGSCRWSEDPSLVGEVRECTIDPTCTSATDCQEAPFGVCRGNAYAVCKYPGEDDEPCSTDADCTTLPGGTCAVWIEAGVTLCYPDGACEEQVPFCSYPSVSCDEDADCSAVPGGYCAKRIDDARCEYHGCLTDTDCPAGERCACAPYDGLNACVPADCTRDADCEGGRCRLEYGCYGALLGYGCSTRTDACGSDLDCNPGSEDCHAPGASCTYFDVNCARGTAGWECVRRDCPLID